MAEYKQQVQDLEEELKNKNECIDVLRATVGTNDSTVAKLRTDMAFKTAQCATETMERIRLTKE